MTPAEMVREFHETYGCVVRTEPGAEVPEKELRMSLIAEEAEELRDALGLEPEFVRVVNGEYLAGGGLIDARKADTVEVADALADLVYVAYGAALTFGIDLDAVLAEVHRSNMSKLGADGKPIVRADGKILKGPQFSEPDIAAVLGGSALDSDGGRRFEETK